MYRRKIIALTAIATLEPQGETHTLYAACNDGTIWTHQDGRDEWQEMPAIPDTLRPTFNGRTMHDDERDEMPAKVDVGRRASRPDVGPGKE